MKALSINEAIKRIPQYLYDSLINQYDHNTVDRIIKGYMASRYTTLRVNLLKADVLSVMNRLKDERIKFDRVSWSNEALIIKNVDEKQLAKLDIYEKGLIYLQSLSSMLPPIILNPKKGMSILDMASAPGGKTTELASLTNNESQITCLELDPIRFEKLKYNLNKQGATSVIPLLYDGRKYENEEQFDYILLDAPCSGSGTIDVNNKASYISFSEKLVTKSASTQKSMLRNALKLIKKSQTILYSTCSILQRENEDVINEILSENKDVEVVQISFNGMNFLPLLPCKIKGALTICPNELYEGFFVCKLRKK